MTYCRAGDLARIVHPSAYGKLVSVLYAAPDGNLILPDGVKAFHSSGERGWIIQMLGEPIEAAYWAQGYRTTRLARYAACADRWLRPIRDPGDDAIDEISTRKPAEHDTTLTPKPQREHCL